MLLVEEKEEGGEGGGDRGGGGVHSERNEIGRWGEDRRFECLLEERCTNFIS